MNQGDAVELLLVEDNPEDAELVMHALKKANLAAHLAHVKDGAEALDFLFAQGEYAARVSWNLPRVVFLDLKLPKVDVLEVLAKLKADPRTKTIPVVMLTSSNQDRDIFEAYKLGANSYIVKPVSFDGLVRAIGELGLYWLTLNKYARQ